MKPLGTDRPVHGNIYLLDAGEAEHLFLDPASAGPAPQNVDFRKIAEAGAPRVITIGVQKVAEEPEDAEFDAAARYVVAIPAEREGRILEIDYRGDVARIYADGKLVADNFYNGRPMLLGLWRLPEDCKEVELRILPLQPDMPVYFPREADIRPGEEVKSMVIK